MLVWGRAWTIVEDKSENATMRNHMVDTSKLVNAEFNCNRRSYMCLGPEYIYLFSILLYQLEAQLGVLKIYIDDIRVDIVNKTQP